MIQPETVKPETLQQGHLVRILGALTAVFTGSVVSPEQISAAEINQVANKPTSETNWQMTESSASRYGVEDVRAAQQTTSVEQQEVAIYPPGTEVILNGKARGKNYPGTLALIELNKGPKEGSGKITEGGGFSDGKKRSFFGGFYRVEGEDKEGNKFIAWYDPDWFKVVRFPATPIPPPTRSPMSTLAPRSAEVGTKASHHVVQSGETLSTIAPHYGLTWLELAELNNIEPPYTIGIGQPLKVSKNMTASAARADAALVERQTIYNQQENSAGTFIHVVKVDEVLGNIANKYGTTVKKLMELNRLANENLIYEGQKLNIPITKEAVGQSNGQSMERFAKQYTVTQEREFLVTIANQYRGMMGFEEYFKLLQLANPGINTILTQGQTVNLP